jgi:KDO2-lipid IV(A) palmitoleoyltransferase
MGLCQPMMATYRPHNNPLMEWVQTRGRMRSNKAMISRNNLRGMVGALKKGEAVWFAPIRITDVKAAALHHSLRLKT